MRLLRRFLPILAALMLAGCGNGSEERPTPIPRPRAYPRPRLYPAAYHEVPIGNLRLNINDSARIAEPRSGWLDIHYPAYGITVNATLTPVSPSSLPSVLANRHERIARDLDGVAATVEQSSGRTLIISPAALRTPLHYLATDSATYVLSAVAVADWPANAPLDSITPYVNAVAADLMAISN